MVSQMGEYLNNMSAPAFTTDRSSEHNERLIKDYSLFISLFFLLSVPVAVIFMQNN